MDWLSPVWVEESPKWTLVINSQSTHTHTPRSVGCCCSTEDVYLYTAGGYLLAQDIRHDLFRLLVRLHLFELLSRVMCNAMFLRLCAASLILWLGTVKGAKPVVRSMSIDAKGKIKANQKAKSVIRKVHGTKDSNAKVDVALTRDTSSCYVTVYEHWPENIAAGISGLEAAESAWGGHFPTGASMVLQGVGDHPLGALSNLTSSVKVEGPCCKAYGYATSSCADSSQGSPIEATTQLIEGLPAGVVTPATGLASLWSCNDCTQCVKVVQECTFGLYAHGIINDLRGWGRPIGAPI